jgi:chromosome segregation ATPase
LRAQWSQITGGETYGKVKAEEWAPKPPEKLDDEDLDVESLAAQIEVLQATVANFNQQLGSKRGEIEERERLRASEARLDKYVHNLGTLRADLANIQLELNGGERDGKTYVGAVEEVGTAEELIGAAERALHSLTCPNCGAALKMGMEDLEFVASEDLNFEKSEDELKEMRTQVHENKIRIERLQSQAETLIKQIGAAENSQKLRQEITSKLLTLAKPEDLAAVQEELQTTQQELSALTEQMRRAEGYTRQVEANKKAQEDALRVHRTIQNWALAEEAMAPTGIPQELLSEALEVINKRMLKSARAVKWQAPKITPDMTIVREGGDTYGLLSEGAKWRVGVIVAEAIASMSGINMLIIDRMDVLDPQSRVPFLEWIRSIAPDYDTILIMATMKDKPRGLPPQIEVHWLVDGDEAQPEAAA